MARLRKTLTDYVVIAISPALIMTLIGSLVFFLLEVFYQGQYSARLHWIFGLFVMATVLIGRISIDEGREYALFFAAPLGIVTLLAVLKFVQFSGPLAGVSTIVNIGMIALIWWCADRLTWDCTVIDEREDASGEGLLQTAGLDRRTDGESPGEADRDEDPDATSSRETKPLDLWHKFLERRRRPHAPGVWVVYFSLVALPLFGIGQRFIPTGDLESRRSAFWLLSIYVASGLGLLMTTSFLGLRRYLRQRRLEMPIEMAGVWLTVGTVMIVALLVVCTALPRPSAEYSVTHLSFRVGSPEDLEPNRYGMGSDGVEDEQGESQTASVDDKAREGEATGKDAKRKGGKSGSKGAGGDSKSKDGSPGKGENDSKGQKRDGQGKQDGGKSGSKDDRGEGKDSGKSSSGDSSKKDGERSTDDEKTEESQGESDGQNGSGSEESGSEDQQREASQSGTRSGARSDSSRFSPSRMLNSITGGIPQILKALYWLLFIAVVGYFAWRYRTQVLAAITGFVQSIREFLERLFGGRGAAQAEDEAAAAALPPPPRPFADYADPFTTGAAASYTPQQLVAYTFEAVEAWAREHGCERGAEQTAHEFAGRVAACAALVGAEARTLADLYCTEAYSAESLSRTSVQRLERLWQALRANVSQEVVGA